MNKICRLCLKSVHPTNNTFISVHQTDNNGVPISTLVKTLVPELYLGLSVNPVICSPCYDAIRDAYSFRLQCLRSENLIGIFMRETHASSITIVLQDVVDYWKKVYKEKPCRTDVARANLSEWFGVEEQIKKDEDKTALGSAKEIEPVAVQVIDLEAVEKTEPLAAKVTEPIAVNETETMAIKVTEPLAAQVTEPVSATANEPPSPNCAKVLEGLAKGKARLDKLLKENAKCKEKLKSTGGESVLKPRLGGKRCEAKCDPATDAEVERIVKTVLDRERERRLKARDTYLTLLPEHEENAVAHEEQYTPLYELKKITADMDKANEKDSYLTSINFEEQASVLKPKETSEIFVAPNETDTLHSSSTDCCPTNVDFELNVPVGMRSAALEDHKECDVVCGNPQGAMHKPNTTSEDSEMSNETDRKPIYKDAYSRLRPPMAKTYTRTRGGLSGTSENSEALAESGMSDANNRVHMLYDDDEIDVKSLLSELQKNKNLEKLGLPNSELDLEKSFIVTKFIDQTDNSLSYALIPRAVTEDLATGVQITDDELSQAILVVKKGLEQDAMTQINDTAGKLLDDETSQTSEQSNSSVSSEKDEESLGFNTFKPNPTTTSEAKRMPMIRVRPVASLQKVRTLNHELFPRQADVATRLTAPGKMIMPPLRSLPAINASMPPVVLNSSIVSGIGQTLFGPIMLPDPSGQPPQLSPLGPPTITSLGKLDSNPPANPTKLVPVTAEHMKRLGINPLSFKKLRMVRPVRKLLPYAPPPKPVAVQPAPHDNEAALRVPDVSELAENNQNSNKPINDEEIIDIKDEPLDYGDGDSLNELETLDTLSNQSGGETTRSASETSLMDQVNSDNLSHLLESIPDVDQQMYDEPEYVHINNVSFADLTKLVKESKGVNSEQIAPADPVSSGSRTKRFSSTSARGRRKQQMRLKTVYRQDTDYSPLPPSRRARLGKRWRLVQVDEYGNDVLKKRKLQPVTNAPREIQPAVERQSRDVCVLFTNFTSEGDYINDHDYLINPYLRNNMLSYKRGIESCLCSLCDIVHPVSTHSVHMKCHGTRCLICQVDFHNVFILNLHVRKHTSYCTECRVNVTYSRYRHHAECHNRSLYLSNIDLLPEDRSRKKSGVSRSHVTLADALDTPSVCTTDADRSTEQRRSRRLTRSRKSESLDLDEEEACIYDKVSKRFITPTRDKQQKLLAKCSAKVKKTEDEEICDKTADGQNEFITLTDLLESSEKPNINVKMSVDKIDLTLDSPKPPNVNRKAVPRPRPKRRRIFSTKRRRRMIRKREFDDSAQQPDVRIKDGIESEQVQTEEKVTDEPKREIVDTAIAPDGNLDNVTSDLSVAPTVESSESMPQSSNAEPGASAKKLVRRNPDFVISQSGKLLPQREKRTLRTNLSFNPANRRQKLRRRATSNGTKIQLEDAYDMTNAPSPLPEEVPSDQTQKKMKRNPTAFENHPQDTLTALSETKPPRKVTRSTASKVVINPLSAARSTRSRGSWNLIEGLNIDGPVRGKKPRKSTTPHVDNESLKNKNADQPESDVGQLNVGEPTELLNSDKSESVEVDETAHEPRPNVDDASLVINTDNQLAESSQTEKTSQAEESKPFSVESTKSPVNINLSGLHLVNIDETSTSLEDKQTKESMDIDLANSNISESGSCQVEKQLLADEEAKIIKGNPESDEVTT